MSVCVFLGPSLGRDEARRLCDADYLPPARHGDVYRLLALRPRAIVLIDGIYHSTPSVWQRELLAAVDEGIPVIGAASMGALRAAELAHDGVLGVGTVFEWLVQGVIDGDDEVALVHADLTHGFRAMSEPLVNIRATLARAEREGVLLPAEAAALVQQAKATYFPERALRRLLDGFDATRRAALDTFFRERAVDLKAEDARAALRHAATLSAPPAHGPGRRHLTLGHATWDRTEALTAVARLGGREVLLRNVLQAVLDEPYRYADVLAPGAASPLTAVNMRLTARYYLASFARQHGVAPPSDYVSAFAEAHRARYLGAPDARQENGLAATVLEHELRERAVCAWLRERGAAGFGLAAAADPDVPFITAWAANNGIAASPEELLRRGPLAFGYTVDLDVQFIREVQLLGLVPRVAAELP